LALDILGAPSRPIAPTAIRLSLLLPKVLECAILSIGLFTPFVEVFDELTRSDEGHPPVPGAQRCIIHLETTRILMFQLRQLVPWLLEEMRFLMIVGI
jgi:hypothetical protein